MKNNKRSNKRHNGKVKRTRRVRRGGKLMFNGSYPKAPVVCLAGTSKIPCTAVSGA